MRIPTGWGSGMWQAPRRGRRGVAGILAGAMALLLGLSVVLDSASTAVELQSVDQLGDRSAELSAAVAALGLREVEQSAAETGFEVVTPIDPDTLVVAPAQLPEAATARVSLGGASIADAGAQDAVFRTAAQRTVDDDPAATPGAYLEVGGLPMTFAPAGSAPAPTDVSVSVASQDEASQLGVDGVVVDIADVSVAGIQPDSQVQVTIDYGGFAGLAWSDWATRLQLVAIPQDCVEPDDPVTGEPSVVGDDAEVSCAPVPLATSVNDIEQQSITATVDLGGAASPSTQIEGVSTHNAAYAATSSGSAVRLALTSGSAGASGNWGATSLAPSASWGMSGGTGAFTWSYPLTVPQTAAGLAPELSLSYSSAGADGRTASTNNQASWVGEGWDLTSSYVERKYVPCAEDVDKVGDHEANNRGATLKYAGDLCWGVDNATLVLNGSAVELVKDKNDGSWHSKSEDGATIQLIIDDDDDDDVKESWLVTTVDGTKYSFGSVPSSQSRWTVPVFGNHETEQCHASTFKKSSCEQVWRWNLDFVQDVAGSTMRYQYAKDVSAYKSPASATPLQYNPGGRLTSIEYGTREGLASPGGAAPARVAFTAVERCTSKAAGEARKDDCALGAMVKNSKFWPDVPVDLYCAPDDEAKCKTRTGPAFFDRYRLSTITTSVFDGSAWHQVDTWSLVHEFVDPNQHTDNTGTKPAVDVGAILWLSSITHKGHRGAEEVSTPPAVFRPTYLPNRVQLQDNPGPPMSRPRIDTITTESGAHTAVTYRTDCESLPSSPAANDRLCFPVGWDHKHKDDYDWFYKYVVSGVTESGGKGTSFGDAIVTKYAYGGTPRWVKPTGALVKPKEVTYSDFKGYADVTTAVGAEVASRTHSRSYYLRGTGAQLTAGLGDDPAGVLGFAGVLDDERFAGQVYAAEEWDGAPGQETHVLSRTVNVAVKGEATATAADGVQATPLGSSTAFGLSYDRAGELLRVTRTSTTYNEHGQVAQIEDLGQKWPAKSDDNLCTEVTYLHESGSGLDVEARRALVAGNRVGLVQQTTVTEGSCAAENPEVLSRTKAVYGEKDRVVQTYELAADSSQLVRTESTQYDDWGRVVKVTDAADRSTVTAYSPKDAALVESVAVTTPPVTSGGAGLTTTTVYDPGSGTVTQTVDANGQVTRGTYDGLGRLLTVRFPDRLNPTACPLPSIQYEYVVRRDGRNAVITRTIAADGVSQVASSQIYDGLMRLGQSQSTSADAGSKGKDGVSTRGRVITGARYDSAGRLKLKMGPWWASGQVNSTVVKKPDNVNSLTEYRYDAMGRVLDETLYQDGTDRKALWSTKTIYDGDSTTTIPPEGGTTTTVTVDASGRTVSLKQHDKRPTRSSDGKTLTWQAGTATLTTRYGYDASGQMTSMTDPKGNTWTYVYDNAGQLVSSTDPDAGTTTTTYDKVGRRTEVRKAKSETLTETLTYEYDGVGRVTAVKQDGTALTEFTYDTVAKGMVSSSTRVVDGQRYTTTIDSYDWAYRPTKTTVTLPAVGDLAKLPSRKFETEFAYTADGQTAAVTLPKVRQKVGTKTSTVLGKERVTTYFDTASVPRWMGGGFGWGTYVADSRTDAFGAPMAQDLGNTYGTVVTYGYDRTTSRLTNINLDREQVVGTDLALTYAYDDAGNVTQAFDTPTAYVNPGKASQTKLPSHKQCFAYDGLRRLTVARTTEGATCTTTTDTTGAAPYWQEYKYDALGNRTELVQKKFGALATDLTTTYQYGKGQNATGPHQLSSAVTKAGTSTQTASMVFEYDLAGNQTKRTGTGSPSQILTWDAEGELRQVNTTGASATGEGTMTNGEASFVYDASGERLVRKTAGGTTVYLPGGQEFTVQSSGEVAATRYYSFAGSTVAVRTGRGLGGVDSIVCDRNGTPLVSVKNTQRAGQVVKQYTDPFGGIRGGGVSTVPGDRQFVGQPRDDATGLSMLGARYYDEGTGQFLSVDPQLDPSNPAQFNAYVYSGNNPLTWSDPSGLNWFSDKISGAAKAAAGWVNKYQAEIVGAVAGGVTFAGCMVGTAGAGSVGCAAAAGAVGGAVTNLWKSEVQHTQAFSWSSLATDTVVGGVMGAAGGVIGKAVAPIAKTLAASVSNSVRTATAKAGGAVASAARQAGDGVKTVAKRATNSARSVGGKSAAATGDTANTARAGAANGGSPLADASAAAFRAADNPASIFIKNKHLASSGIRGGRFASDDVAEVQRWVARGLRSDGVQFLPNQLDDTFRAIVPAGRVVGTGGQTNIRVIVTNDGRVINAFPVHVR